MDEPLDVTVTSNDPAHLTHEAFIVLQGTESKAASIATDSSQD